MFGFLPGCCVFFVRAVILMVFAGCGAVFMLLAVAGAYATACYWAYLFEPLLDKWSPELHCRDINTDIMPMDAQQHSTPANTNYYGTTQTMGSSPSQQPYQSLDSSAQPVGTSPVGLPTYTAQHQLNASSADIPTHYDYSQLQQQVSQGVEMGMVNMNYQ